MAQKSGLERRPGDLGGYERIKGARAKVVAPSTGGRGKGLRGVTEPRAHWEVQRKRAIQGSLESELSR